LTLPNVAINTASYYSGVVFFLALFRTMLWSGERDRGVIKAAIPLAVISAAACTLRQNYIPVPLVTLGTYYTFRWWYAERGRRTRSLAEAMVVGALLLGALAPWLVVSFQSNRTLFYPLMLGTANPAVSLQSSGITFLRELQIQIGVPLDGLPLKTFAVFLLAVAFLRDEAPGRPLWALTMGSIAGSIAVVHGLTQSDAGNIARYAFGFFLALALAVALSSSILRPSAASRSMVPAGLVLLGMAVQFPASRESFIRASTYALQNIDVLAHQAPRSARSSTPEAQLYSALQGSIPASARVAVMVDEPHYLNFARNPIWNLDMPGYSSLPPNLPYFQGSEKVVEYFRGLGVRYLAFVAEGYSRYHYRRSYWVEMLIDEQEIWRVHAPYLIDFVDNLAAIGRRYHHVFDERGMLVVDLEAPP
jgi:hypothetical protein